MNRIQTTAGLVQVNDDGSAFWVDLIPGGLGIYPAPPTWNGYVRSTMTDRELALFRELMEERKKHETKPGN